MTTKTIRETVIQVWHKMQYLTTEEVEYNHNVCMKVHCNCSNCISLLVCDGTVQYCTYICACIIMYCQPKEIAHMLLVSVAHTVQTKLQCMIILGLYFCHNQVSHVLNHSLPYFQDNDLQQHTAYVWISVADCTCTRIMYIMCSMQTIIQEK